MGRRWRRAAIGWSVLIALSAACSSATTNPGRPAAQEPSPPATTSSPTSKSTVIFAELQQRPLRFPAPETTGTCPADPQARVTPNPKKPAEFAFGSGPAYVSGNNAWYAGPPGQGANLLFDTHSSGPMLVRTRRLDGVGHLSLTNAYIPAQAREPWRLAATETSDGLEIQVPALPDHWPVWSGRLTTDSQGCFGLGVDGDGFAGTIVIKVLPGPIPPG